MRRDLNEKKEVSAAESRADIKTIKQELDASSLLASLAASRGLLVEKYAVSKGKDGSDRIKCGSRNLNVGDFLTQEMRMSWKEAEQVLRAEHARQVKGQRFEATPTPIRQPRKELWAEFDMFRPTPADRKAAWDLQKKATEERRLAIKTNYYAEKAALDGKPTPGKRAALSLLRMKKLQEEADLREQVKREKEALKARYNKKPADAYRDWLHAQAEAGREAALEELRRMRVEPFPAPKPGDAAIKGNPERTPIYQSLNHVVHRNGDVTYLRGQEAILRDTARAVNVIQTDHDTIEAGLRLALSKFGPKLELTGSDEFKRTTARIAAQAGLKVEFDDPALNDLMQRERAAIEEQRQFVPQTRAKIIQRADGPAIDQRREDKPVEVERRKERVAAKIKEEEAEQTVETPVEKPRAPRMR